MLYIGFLKQKKITASDLMLHIIIVSTVLICELYIKVHNEPYFMYRYTLI